MSDIKYKIDNPAFEKVLRLLNYSFLKEYSEEDIKEIREICEQIVKIDCPINLGRTLNFDRDDIKNFFLETIASIGNKDILEYYRKRVESMEIYFRRYIKKEGAQINLGIKDNKIVCGPILLPERKNIKEYDLLSFSHEMGHVACYENKNLAIVEYFEYSEVIPILFEYFASLQLDRRRPTDFFFRNRLSCEQKAASLILEILDYWEKSKDEKAKSNCLITSLIEDSKYLYSSDTAFQFIDLMRTDKKEVAKLISEVVIGDKSVKDMTEHFNINSSGKRLIKEIPRRIYD